MVMAGNTKIEASLGFTRKWNAREAGREVAKSAINGLNQPPSFFLLFTSIHYKDLGGFDELLNGVWDVLPIGTPLIGGTSAGFINNYGCFGRGATALAVAYPNMDVGIGIGRRTKISPKSASSKCANMIKKELKKTKYDQKFLIDMISGGKVPNLPVRGLLNYVKSPILGNIAVRLFPIFQYMGFLFGREEELLDCLSSKMREYYIIGGTSIDEGNFLVNYQFFKDKVYTDAIVALGVAIDTPIFMTRTSGLGKHEKKFRVTKTRCKRRVMARIENKKAKDFYFKEILGLSEDQINKLGSNLYYKFAYFFPFSLDKKGGYSTGLAGFFGNNVAIAHSINDYISVNFVNGKDLFDSIFTTFNDKADNTRFPFMLIFSSSHQLLIRNKIFRTKEILDKKLGDTPYLVIQPMIENTYVPNENPYVGVYGFNTLSVLKEDSI